MVARRYFPAVTSSVAKLRGMGKNCVSSSCFCSFDDSWEGGERQVSVLWVRSKPVGQLEELLQ